MQNDTAACNITRSHALMPVRHAVIEDVYATDTNVQVSSTGTVGVPTSTLRPSYMKKTQTFSSRVSGPAREVSL
ncbi:hypothetical protein Ctob_015699 [Chrysochromulina tobinii]|uniref:Uncharacterized protein n=1 Tax=Chrysochromulina tobinii TaxID=1460289 RepID=A0A0M0KA38_9EUKA|nr:hypothetical protein Ctob_015699 [Chrysochromulina tobinii]|eukprot:KOO35695.1 hypothetical protein Ctob_015699 [Chrysochromulina sp. CCMP291]